MARPTKNGLDYFPLDVNFFTDEKTEAIMGEFGLKGTSVMTYLFMAVYQNGYFLEWNKLKQMQAANRLGLSAKLVNQVVNQLVVYGVFNESLFQSANVLTSLRIQETYLEATARRKNVTTEKYWLIKSDENAEDNQEIVNDNINSSSVVVNDNINTQSKVNEIKPNQTKPNQSKLNKKDKEPGHPQTDDFSEFNSLFANWLKNFTHEPNKTTKAKLVKLAKANDVDLLNYAIDLTGLKKSGCSDIEIFNYMNAIVRNWNKQGIETTEQAKNQSRNMFNAKTDNLPKIPIFQISKN